MKFFFSSKLHLDEKYFRRIIWLKNIYAEVYLAEDYLADFFYRIIFWPKLNNFRFILLFKIKIMVIKIKYLSLNT